MIEQERIKKLNTIEEKKGKYGVCWMQASQRVFYNFALNYAIELSNKFKIPLLVIFGLTENYLNASERHYAFMLQGLSETFSLLNQKGIDTKLEFVNEPYEAVLKYSKDAAFVVGDVGYTKIQKNWREKLKQKLKCAYYLVESDVVVPVEEVSAKEEFGAYTIRPKIIKKIFKYINNRPGFPDLNEKTKKIKKINFDIIFKRLKFNNRTSISKKFKGGYSDAKHLLNKFIKEKLKYYERFRNDPSKDFQSDLSPYIHFGQISTLEIAQEVLKTGINLKHQFLDELIIRRELAINFVYYNKDYDNFNSLPNWSKDTLLFHESDKREYNYNLKQLENAETYDIYWNAAQKELIKTGKMHGYMRMYWGKKVIEWTKSVIEAYHILIYLNDKYELDGRDPNGYAGIAWCFGKHDRPWGERKIFGKVRYLNKNGLKKKFDMEKYVKRVEDE